MKKAGKIIALLLALVMAASLFVACRDNNGEEGGDPPLANNVNNNQGTDDPGTDDPPAPPVDPDILMGNVHPVVDMGGRTLRLVSWIDEGIPELMDGDEPDPATSTDYEMDRLRWDNARRIEAQFNVRFEKIVIPWDDLLHTLTTGVVGGNPVGDVWMLPPVWQTGVIEGNLIQQWPSIAGSDLFGGQIVTRFVPTLVDPTNPWFMDRQRVYVDGMYLGVNLDIINAEGLPNPIELFEQGNWTWEAALDIMRRATTSTRGDGVIDQFGIAGQPGDLINAWISTNDGMMVTPDLMWGYSEPSSIEALEFWQNVIQEGLWSHHPDTVDVGDWGRNFWSGMREANAALFQAATWSIQSETPAFEFGVVPFPMGPSNYSGALHAVAGEQAWALPAGANNRFTPEETLILMEELYSWFINDVELVVDDALGWLRSVLPTEGDVQRVVQVGNNMRVDVGGAVTGLYQDNPNAGFNWVAGAFAEDFLTGERGVMDSLEYHRPPRQEMLDAAFHR